MKIAIVLGTRPEIIKMAPIIRICEEKGLDYSILHTGQHYDYKMDGVFFRELELPTPGINLGIGSGTHGETTGKMLIALEKEMKRTKPDIVLVQGDTNTVLAASLTAAKMQIALGHVEAGLRSHDKRQPEEYNRIIADHLADYLFAPTKKAEANLLREGISKEKIFITGNTIVDTVYQTLDMAKKKSEILEKLGLEKGRFFLVTAHREENVDDKVSLSGILDGLKKISKEYGMPIVFPIHPRTKKRIDEFGLKDLVSGIKNLELIEPVGFLDLLTLEDNARLVLTDSGGLQEESCILRVPCVSLRDKSDRSETIDVGASVLAGCKPDRIFKMAKFMMGKKREWPNPYGDGHSGDKIVKIIKERL